MVTGASTADLAVLLVDARKGVLTQTRRHRYLAQLVGIRRFVLAVNKMDLVDYDQARVRRDRRRLSRLRRPASGSTTGSRSRSPGSTATMSCSRSERDALVRRADACSSISTRVPLDVAADAAKPFRMPVQWVNRPNQDFRGFAGPDRVRARSAPGDEVRDPAVGPDDADRADRHRGRRPRSRRSPASRSR